jgi:tetratricopeptide (TPR) repeat protein
VVPVLAAVAIVAGLVGVAAYLLFLPSSRLQPVRDDGRRGVAAGEFPDARPVEVAVATLRDYYEHTIEHTPPRDPTGAMQRRERHYRSPGDPFGILEERLRKSDADVALSEKMRHWRQKWEAGKLARPAEASGLAQMRQRFGGQLPSIVLAPSALDADVGDLARQSSLKANDLLEIGRAFDFLEGDEAAAVWFQAALAKAQTEYDKTEAGDPIARPFLYQLEQTTALWRLSDYQALEERFALAMALNPPLSVESRRAGCLHATVLYYQGRSDDAADAILKVWEQQKQAGDLGALEKSDFGEMGWVTALYLYSARRYDEAIPYYRAFLLTDDNRKPSGAMMFANCLTMTGKKDEAELVRKRYGIATPPTRPVRMRSTTLPATRPAI